MRPQAAWRVFAIVISLAGLSGAWAEDVPAQAPEGAGEMARQLVVTAKSLNQVLPQKVDETLTFSSVSADGLTLTYHYAFTDPAVKASDRVAELNKRNLAQSCHHPGMRQMMSVLDVAFVYSYAPATGEAPVEARIDEKACRDYDRSRWK